MLSPIYPKPRIKRFEPILQCPVSQSTPESAKKHIMMAITGCFTPDRTHNRDKVEEVTHYLHLEKTLNPLANTAQITKSLYAFI